MQDNTGIIALFTLIGVGVAVYFAVAKLNDYAESRYNFRPITKPRIYVMMIPGLVSVLSVLGAIGSAPAQIQQMQTFAGVIVLGTCAGMLWSIAGRTNWWIGLLATALLFLIGAAGFGVLVVYLIWRFFLKDDKKGKREKRGLFT